MALGWPQSFPLPSFALWQVAHKQGMGEMLHLVDFDQLKIENVQYMQRIAAKNQELLALKKDATDTVQVRVLKASRDETGLDKLALLLANHLFHHQAAIPGPLAVGYRAQGEAGGPHPEWNAAAQHDSAAGGRSLQLPSGV